MLIPQNQASLIPEILEEMREILCRHDIQSRKVRKYFQRHLHTRTDHFIHEFYNFAISPFDIVSYDRHVDYSTRTHSTTTVEISSNDSSDGEIQVVDIETLINEEISNTANNPVTTVMEISGAREENCVIADINPQNNSIAGNETEGILAPESEVIVESSDSECQFVLALKPPEQRTPEMVSLDSASDSDVVFIPNKPSLVTRVDSSTTDSEDNQPLAATKKQLKAESDESKPDIKIKEDTITINMPTSDKPIQNNDTVLNYGASTSKGVNPSELNNKLKKIYFTSKRKRLCNKSIFETSSTNSSSSSSSDSEWNTTDANQKDKNKTKSRRKMSAKKLKRIRISSAITKNPKPLNQLQSSEETHNSESEQPRIKSVIIKKNDNEHYIQRSSNSETSLSTN